MSNGEIKYSIECHLVRSLTDDESKLLFGYLNEQPLSRNIFYLIEILAL